jgi:predicted AAA+ superfamily ATPase
MKFKRKQSIEKAYYAGRVLIIYGPRRVGKTTMLQTYLTTQKDKRILSVQGEDADVQDIFDSQQLQRLITFASAYDIIAIDEAQQVPH